MNSSVTIARNTRRWMTMKTGRHPTNVETAVPAMMPSLRKRPTSTATPLPPTNVCNASDASPAAPASTTTQATTSARMAQVAPTPPVAAMAVTTAKCTSPMRSKKRTIRFRPRERPGEDTTPPLPRSMPPSNEATYRRSTRCLDSTRRGSAVVPSRNATR